MREIYWITRLDDINILFGWIIAIPIMICAIFFFLGLIANENDKEVAKWVENKWKSLRYWLLSLFVVGFLGWAFIPTKTDMLIIYGIGGSIDYLRDNPVAKQLPNKCIKAIDAWVDELYPDSYKQNNDNTKASKDESSN